MNKYGKYIKTLVGVSALAFIFGMNARHALTGYGVKDGKLHIEVLAQSNSGSGTGTGSGSGTGTGTSLLPPMPPITYFRMSLECGWDSNSYRYRGTYTACYYGGSMTSCTETKCSWPR